MKCQGNLLTVGGFGFFLPVFPVGRGSHPVCDAEVQRCVVRITIIVEAEYTCSNRSPKGSFNRYVTLGGGRGFWVLLWTVTGGEGGFNTIRYVTLKKIRNPKNLKIKVLSII